MDLLLSSEQQLLQDSVAKFFARHGGVKRARALRGSGFDIAVHRAMAAEGWFGILVPQEHGGLGLGLTELALVLEQAGRVLAPEPIAVTALAAAAVARRASTPWAAVLLADILSGKRIVALALGTEAASSGESGITAEIQRGSARLAGRIDDVAPAGDCHGILIAAHASIGPVLCHLSRATDGIVLGARATVDGRPFGSLALDGARTTEIIDGHGSIYDVALFAAAAELLGVMGAALDLTVEYLKTRKQFGKPIGSFQALQHRAVDCYTRIASTRSLLFQIAGQGVVPSPAMASALKAHAAGEALAVTKSAIQMHGAIGFTDEHDAGLFLKRAMWLSAWLGNEAVHRKRYTASIE